MFGTTLLVKRTWLGFAAGLAIAVLSGAPAAAQCPNNCTGHGNCVPSVENRRLQCECFDGWTGSACSRSESASDKAKAKEKEPEMIVDIPEEEPAEGSNRRGRPAKGVRAFEDVAASTWKGLRQAEQSLLTTLGWERKTWDAKRSPRTVWPQAMQQPFEGLNAGEQGAVLGLGLTERDWNKGKALSTLMQYGV